MRVHTWQVHGPTSAGEGGAGAEMAAVGDAAPDFSVPNLEGTDVYTLEDARGEILLLTIFSSL